MMEPHACFDSTQNEKQQLGVHDVRSLRLSCTMFKVFAATT